MSDIVWFLIVGLIAGWLAGLIMKGRGFGVIGDIIVGIVGALIGGFVFGALGIGAGGILGSILVATIGAVILLFIASLFNRSGGPAHI
ncbi:MAG: GlsB/YeaQ/YmgE family stress response membrane protein [Candidatus Andersenbacteria bacterium]|nr:GlsB/YeaQ/YmgE family stress response membrane protein [Candidatus Andersenbacteria bacterium]MBI3251223.1 GlsB/YeaQ/YmgE family stress response membrane protein [Candidatus Andersenbacteria bacterium]